MKIILTQDVPGVGRMGEIKVVADGYARNYLIPKGLAQLATPGAVKEVEKRLKAEEKRNLRRKLEAQELANRLAEMTFTFKAKVGESDRLYGSITSADIAEAIQAQTGQEVDKRRIELEHPIRELGTFSVPVKLAPEVTANITVVVEREEEAAQSSE